MDRVTLDVIKDAKESGYKYVVIGSNRCNQDVFYTNDISEADNAHDVYRSFGSHTTTYEDGLIMKVSS